MTHHARLRALAGTLTAAVVLTACGGGGDDAKDEPTPKDSPPSKADFQQAQKALTGLQADYQAVYDAGARLQKKSVSYFKTHPDGTADDAVFEPLSTAFDEAVSKRDEAADEVEKLDALEDSDVATAYKTFSAKAERGDQFHDSLFAAFPLVQQTLPACGDVFSSTKVDDSVLPLLSAAGFGRAMLARYRPAIADCLPVLEELSASENADLAAFGSGFAEIVTQRRTLMTQLSTSDVSMQVFTRRYERVAARVKKVTQNLEFQKKLNSLSPVPEFLALQKVVAGKAA